MTLQMTRQESEAFLADVHVGVLSIADGERGPLTAPIWYLYEPGGDILLSMGRNSRKGKLLSEGTRVSLVAQTETPPYQYVSVEGPVAEIREGGDRDFSLRLATRYLGEEGGRRYVERSGGGGDGSIIVRVRPERWLTTDYGKR